MTSPWYFDGIDTRDAALSLPADFHVGDVVTLRAQLQVMTVEEVCGCGAIHVAWFSGNDDDGWSLHRDVFDQDMLENLDGEED